MHSYKIKIIAPNAFLLNKHDSTKYVQYQKYSDQINMMAPFTFLNTDDGGSYASTHRAVTTSPRDRQGISFRWGLSGYNTGNLIVDHNGRGFFWRAKRSFTLEATYLDSGSRFWRAIPSWRIQIVVTFWQSNFVEWEICG